MEQKKWEFVGVGEQQGGFAMVVEPGQVSVRGNEEQSQAIGEQFVQRYLLHGLLPQKVVSSLTTESTAAFKKEAM